MVGNCGQWWEMVGNSGNGGKWWGMAGNGGEFVDIVGNGGECWARVVILELFWSSFGEETHQILHRYVSGMLYAFLLCSEGICY